MRKTKNPNVEQKIGMILELNIAPMSFEHFMRKSENQNYDD